MTTHELVSVSVVTFVAVLAFFAKAAPLASDLLRLTDAMGWSDDDVGDDALTLDILGALLEAGSDPEAPFVWRMILA